MSAPATVEWEPRHGYMHAGWFECHFCVTEHEVEFIIEPDWGENTVVAAHDECPYDGLPDDEATDQQALYEALVVFAPAVVVGGAVVPLAEYMVGRDLLDGNDLIGGDDF